MSEKKKKKKWINQEIAPLGLWTFMLFFAITLPPFFGFNNVFMHGIALYLLLVLQTGAWFMAAFQRYIEEVLDG